MKGGNLLSQDIISNTQNKMVEKLIIAFGVIFSLYHIAAAQFFTIDPFVLRTGFLAGVSILTFLYFPSPIKGTFGKALDTIMAIVMIIATVYVAFNYNDMFLRVGISPTFWDTVFGIGILITTLEIARRALGSGLSILAILVLLYAQFGHLLPGQYGHGGFSFERTVSIIFSNSGIMGVPIAVSITYVLPFVIFGAFLEANGTGKYIMDLSQALAGKTKGGPAKMATIASAGVGSINGSPSANVVTTGVITIPMMKKAGYRSTFAGAVEAVASTGGQLLPPVMGASAFIMVELLGLPYTSIIWAALIPALLYYVAVLWVIHLEADKNGLKGLSKENIPNFMKLIIEKGYLLIPMIILILALVVVEFSPMRSALLASVSAIIIPAFRKETRLSLKQILEALTLGAKNTAT